ncbi:Beta-galactosidase C-terminal domain [Micromonospora sp. CPCC 206060]|uniref:Beta-galactosidase C-terminal domain n=1 Tax=Micromonospora sp. CPCC 206060 TaxID=3122406 RepID=UPI002FF1D61E
MLAGQPAVTRHRFGAGTAWYVSTRLDDATHCRLLTDVAHAAGAVPTCPAAPPGVEAVRRRSADTSWLFLLNHTDRPQRVPAAGVDLLTGAPVADAVTLAPGGVAVIREQPAGR